MISIIVPVYKAEAFISKCVDSIIAQTYLDWELLLVDDGSPDRSGEICDEYARKDYRIKVFHKLNGGVSSARNLALDNTNGEWVTFIDADDYILPNFLENLINNSESDIIISGHKRFGIESSEYFIPISKKYLIKEYVEGLFLMLPSDNCYFCPVSYPWGKLFKHNIIEEFQLRFNTKMKLSEDTCFVLDYLSHCKDITCISGGGYMYFVPSKKFYVMNFDEFETHRMSIITSIAKIQKFTEVDVTNFRNSFIVLYIFSLLRFLKTSSSDQIDSIQKSLRKYDFLEIYRIVRIRKTSFFNALFFSSALFFKFPLILLRSYI